MGCAPSAGLPAAGRAWLGWGRAQCVPLPADPTASLGQAALKALDLLSVKRAHSVSHCCLGWLPLEMLPRWGCAAGSPSSSAPTAARLLSPARPGLGTDPGGTAPPKTLLAPGVQTHVVGEHLSPAFGRRWCPRRGSLLACFSGGRDQPPNTEPHTLSQPQLCLPR